MQRIIAITAAVTRQYPVSIAVVACNTASTVSLPALRETFDFPVVGVVPAIKPAARLTRNGVVGVLATRGPSNAAIHSNWSSSLLKSVR